MAGLREYVAEVFDHVYPDTDEGDVLGLRIVRDGVTK